MSIRSHAEHGNEVTGAERRGEVTLVVRTLHPIRSHAERGNEVTGAEHGAEVTGGRARLFLLARRVAGVHLLWDLRELCGLVVLRSHAEHGNEVTGAEHGYEVRSSKKRKEKWAILDSNQ